MVQDLYHQITSHNQKLPELKGETNNLTKADMTIIHIPWSTNNSVHSKTVTNPYFHTDRQ